MDPSTLGQRIRAAREDRGISARDLAAAIGYAPNTVSQWETGKRRVAIEVLIKIAEATAKPLAYFIDMPDGREIGAAQRAQRYADEVKEKVLELMEQVLVPELRSDQRELVEEIRDLDEAQVQEVRTFLEFVRTRQQPRP